MIEKDLTEIRECRGRDSRVVVVGAGISGLAASHRLYELFKAASTSYSIIVCDAGPRVGGVVETIERNGYRIEGGPDSFITNKPWAMDLCRRIGLQDALRATDATFRRSLVLRKGKPVAVPDGFQLLTPVKVGAMLKSPLFSPWGKLRMGLEYLLPCRQPEGDESLESFVTRRFGREMFERLVQPLVGGIYTADPARLSMRATLERFLEIERTHGSLIRGLRQQGTPGTGREVAASGARYGLFATIDEGIGQLVAALVERLQGVADIRLNTRVTRIERASTEPGTRAGYRVLFDGAEPLECDAVIVATPAFVAADLLGDLAPEAASILKSIEYASSAIVVTGHRWSQIKHPLDAFGLVIPAIEKRRILAVSFTSRKFQNRAPAGSVQLRTFVGGAMQPELLANSDEELVAIVRQELASILGVGGTPEVTHVARWNKAMPQYHVGHLDRIDALDRLLANEPGLELAGNAYRGVGLPDCIHSGESAAERLFAKSTRVPADLNAPRLP